MRVYWLAILTLGVVLTAGCQSSRESLPPPATSIQEPTRVPVNGSSTDEGTLSAAKDVAGIIQSLVTAIAIPVGAWWAYNLFMARRQKYPRAKITHQITHLPIADDKLLLIVIADNANPGEVLLSLVVGETRVQQMMPLPSDIAESLSVGDDPVPSEANELEWPIIGRKELLPPGGVEIEPGESDQIRYTFVIGSDVQVIRVYSYFENVKKRGRDLGWNVASVYNIR